MLDSEVPDPLVRQMTKADVLSMAKNIEDAAAWTKEKDALLARCHSVLHTTLHETLAIDWSLIQLFNDLDEELSPRGPTKKETNDG